MRSIPSRTAPRSWQRSSNGSAPLGLSTRRRSILQPIVGSRLPGTIGGTWWLGGASGRAYWPTCCWGPREASPEHLRSVALPGALEPRRPRSGERRGAGAAARPWRARGLAAALSAGLGGRSRGRGLARAIPPAVPDRAPVLPPSFHRGHGSDRRPHRAVSGRARSCRRAGLSPTLGFLAPDDRSEPLPLRLPQGHQPPGEVELPGMAVAAAAAAPGGQRAQEALRPGGGRPVLHRGEAAGQDGGEVVDAGFQARAQPGGVLVADVG